MNEESEEDIERREAFEQIVEDSKTNPKGCIDKFQKILKGHDKYYESPQDVGITRFQEWSIFHLARIHSTLGNTNELIQLLKDIRPNFKDLAKAKTAKIVRTIVDSLGKIPNTEDRQVTLCQEYIEWAKQEKRAFLRQRIQTRLANLYLNTGKFSAALKLLGELQTEVKKLDDKQLLVEIFLLESRVHHALRNVPRSKASLTAARSVSNQIYVGPLLQGEIDMQNGILNADEKDFRTSFSYFFEAFESLHSLKDTRAINCLKYMLLTKIMNNQGDECPAILNTKTAIQYSGLELDAMRAIAKAYKERSLQTFDKVLQEFSDQVVNDDLVQRHMKDLQAKLLEQNLIRLIEPFSRVEITHIAKLINLPLQAVEMKLSQMILDKKLNGILDQGTGELVIFDESFTDFTYDATIDVLNDMGNVVDSLFRRTEQLHT